jgi:hypothetical protein
MTLPGAGGGREDEVQADLGAPDSRPCDARARRKDPVEDRAPVADPNLRHAVQPATELGTAEGGHRSQDFFDGLVTMAFDS